MLIGVDPWFKVLVTVFGKSSGALKAWLWLWPGNDTGNTLTGRFTWKNNKRSIKEVTKKKITRIRKNDYRTSQWDVWFPESSENES